MIPTNNRTFPADAPDSTRTLTWISRITAALVALLALAAFALSFEALKDLAVTTGAISNPNRAWLFPVLLDGGVVVFSLAALRASLCGHDLRWYMSLVILVTLLSMAFNVAHASRGFLPSLMAGMPPLLLFMAFESLMRQIQESIRPAAPRKAVRVFAPKQTEALPAPASDRKIQAISLHSDGWSKSRIAKELKMSPATVTRYLKAA